MKGEFAIEERKRSKEPVWLCYFIKPIDIRNSKKYLVSNDDIISVLQQFTKFTNFLFGTVLTLHLQLKKTPYTTLLTLVSQNQNF